MLHPGLLDRLEIRQPGLYDAGDESADTLHFPHFGPAPHRGGLPDRQRCLPQALDACRFPAGGPGAAISLDQRRMGRSPAICFAQGRGAARLMPAPPPLPIMRIMNGLRRIAWSVFALCLALLFVLRPAQAADAKQLNFGKVDNVLDLRPFLSPYRAPGGGTESDGSSWYIVQVSNDTVR